MGIVRNKLNENPDFMRTGRLDLSWMIPDAVPFGFYKGKLHIGKGGTHGSIPSWSKIDQKLPTPKDSAYGSARYYLENSGRLWKNHKVMSFWKYPSKKEFKKIIDEIGKAIGEPDMFNDPEWKVEIVKSPKDEYKEDKKDIKKDWDRYDEYYNQELIPLKDYTRSNERSNKELAQQHIESPMTKMQRPDKSNFVKISGKKRKPLPWRQAMYAENDEIDFDDPLMEKLLVGEPVSVPELRDILHNKVLNFEFIKLDGDVRPAKGTTMMKYVPKEEQPTGDNPSSEKVAAFYDLDKNAWRSVSNRSKEIVLAIDDKTGKPKIVISDKEPKTEQPASKSLMPREKDVEKRPLVPKVEPVVKPSIKPEVIPPTPSVDELEPEIEEKPLNIQDPNIPADDVKDDEVIVTTQEPEDIEPTVEPAEPSIPMEPKTKPIVRPTITSDVPSPTPSGPQPEILPDKEFKLPPKEDITFPEDEEEESEEIL